MKIKPSLLSALIISVLLVAACSNSEEPETRQIVFNVEGMYCAGCVGAITNEIQRIDGASNISVTLDDSLVVFDIPSNKIPDQQTLRKAIEDLGYIVHFKSEVE
jgi:copper chaperone CopZ